MKNEIRKLAKQIAEQAIKQLEGTAPTELDKYIMIKLTPIEIKNVMRGFATQWERAQLNKTKLPIDEVLDFYYDLSFGILEKTDPDRFIHSS